MLRPQLRRALRVIVPALIVAAALIPAASMQQAHAAAPTSNLGGPVTEYGTNAHVRMDLGRGSEYPQSVSVDSHGRTVIFAMAQRPTPATWSSGYGTYQVPVVLRLTADGTRDASFGTNGVVEFPQYLAPVAVTPDDGFLAMTDSNTADWGLARFDATGHRDMTFGDNGVAKPFVTNSDGRNSWFGSIAFQSTGRILLAGQRDVTGKNEPFVSALTADGHRDNTFGVGGVVNFTMDAYWTDRMTVGVQVSADDTVTLASWLYLDKARLWRLTPNGAADIAFGDLGLVEVPAAPSGSVLERTFGPWALHPSGAITYAMNGNFVRLARNGSVDDTFAAGADHHVDNNYGYYTPQRLVADGEAAVSLTTYPLPKPLAQRINPDGTKDAAFSANVANAIGALSLSLLARDPVTRGFVFTGETNGDVVVRGTSASGEGTAQPNYVNLGRSGGETIAATVGDGNGGIWLAASADVPAIVHLNDTGARDDNFADHGVALLRTYGSIADIARSPKGGVVVVGFARDNDGKTVTRITWLSPDGTRSPNYNDGKAKDVDGLLPQEGMPSFHRIAGLSDGSVAIASYQKLTVVRPDGEVLSSNLFANLYTNTTSVALATRNDGFVVGYHSNNGLELRAFTATLQADDTFGTAGAVTVANPPPDSYQYMGDLRQLVVTPNSITVLTSARVMRLLPNGATDPTFTTIFNPGFPYSPGWGNIAVPDDESVIVNYGTSAFRFTARGALDRSFGVKGGVAPGFTLKTSFAAQSVLPSGSRLYFVGTVMNIDSMANYGTDIGIVARDMSRAGGVPVLVAVNDVRFRENDFRAHAMYFTFDRALESSKTTLSVQYRSGTAKVPNDVGYEGKYDLTSTVYDPARKAFRFYVSAVDDYEAEPAETAFVDVVDAKFAIVGDGTGQITIDNDDPVAAPVAASMQPYGSFAGGANVATGDLDGDGVDEIITAPRRGGGPHVRVLRRTANGFADVTQFMAYDQSFTGGVMVATADVDGDGTDEIITAPESNFAPVVRVFHVAAGIPTRRAQFLAYAQNMTLGVSVAGGDVDGDGDDEVITGPYNGGGPHVRIFSVAANGQSAVQAEFMDYDTAPFAGVGISVAARNRGDSRGNVLVAAGPGSNGYVREYQINGKQGVVVNQINPYGELFRGGFDVAAAPLDPRSGDEIIVTPRTGSPAKIATFFQRYVSYQPQWVTWLEFSVGPATQVGSVRVSAGRFAPDAALDYVTTTPPGRTTTLEVRRITY